MKKWVPLTTIKIVRGGGGPKKGGGSVKITTPVSEDLGFDKPLDYITIEFLGIFSRCDLINFNHAVYINIDFDFQWQRFNADNLNNKSC